MLQRVKVKAHRIHGLVWRSFPQPLGRLRHHPVRPKHAIVSKLDEYPIAGDIFRPPITMRRRGGVALVNNE
ncbi:MAG: hypothetical protein U0796_03640 [Gemmatales bacterium]